MKITKIILTTIMIVVAALGLFRILPFNITNSIMFTSLATLLLLRSIEWKKSRDKTGFLFTFIAAVFISLLFSTFVLHFLDMRKWIIETV